MLRLFFNLRVVSKSPADEISTPIGAVLELQSRTNLPCLVKLALNIVRKSPNGNCKIQTQNRKESILR